MRYNELTLRYFTTAPLCGVLLSSSEPHPAGVFRGAAGRRELGTWVQFDVRVRMRAVLDVRFLALGCPHTIAAAAWIAEQALMNPTRAELSEPLPALARRFEVPVEKMGRLLVVEDAWTAVITAAGF